jgi:hypothetical protein
MIRKQINTEQELKNEFEKIRMAKQGFTLKDCDINVYFETNKKLGFIDFQNCTFTQPVVIKGVFEFRTQIIDCEFKKSVTLSNATFEKEIKFNNTTFHGIANFSKAKFYDLTDFWGVTFVQPMSFSNTEFIGTTNFTFTRFSENVIFTYSHFQKIVIFKNTVFDKGLDLSLAIISGELVIFDIKLGYYESIEDQDNSDVHFNQISSRYKITHKSKRETYRIIKSNFYASNNSIEALRYRRFELKTFKDELSLKSKFSIGNPKWSEFVDWQDRLGKNFILSLNNISNLHGESPLLGFLFTVGLAFVFLYLILLSTGKYEFAYSITLDPDTFRYFFTFINPTHKINYLGNAIPSSLTYVLDFGGRILVGFGIYQFVQAFRQFKK